MNRKNNGTPILSILTSAAIGAALGVLFAPASGKNTRKKIAKTARKYSEPIIDKVESSVDDIYSAGKTVYNRAVGKKEESHTGALLLTIAVAVPVGVALGMLFAPRRGSETRQKIAETAKKGVDGISTTASGIFSKATGAGQQAESGSQQQM